MLYPLDEKIGPPELLVGRKAEFDLINRWIERMPRRLSKSRVILARRKSGKTSFVQRIFNQLWNAGDPTQKRQVIPFFIDIPDKNESLATLAVRYYRTFVSQYISFMERKPDLVHFSLSLEEIYEYGVKKDFKAMCQDAKLLMEENHRGGRHAEMWHAASYAPHYYGGLLDQRFLVMIDEFQYLASHIYRDFECKGDPDTTIPGSFHALSESKLAPMLVTGSYIGILLDIMQRHLEAGRLSITHFTPYLDDNAGLEAAYRYADVYDQEITNQTAQEINELCLSDPFFISCIMLSEFEDKDLTTSAGVIDAVNCEISDRRSELSGTWAEYLRLTFDKVNGEETKNLMLFLNKHNHRFWSTEDIKDKLNLETSKYDLQKKLELLSDSDVIARGSSDIQFSGLQDGTLNLVLQSRFEEEIHGFAPDLKPGFQAQLDELRKDKQRMRGRINHLEGMLAEHLFMLELQAKKYVHLSDYFIGGTDNSQLNLIDVQERVPFRRSDGKAEEIDIIAKADDGRVLMIEVRKRQKKTDLKDVTDLRDNALDYAQQHDAAVLPAFLSLGGFTKDAQAFCAQHGIATSEKIEYYP